VQQQQGTAISKYPTALALAERARALLTSLDGFTLAQEVAASSLLVHPRPLGGALTLMACLTTLTLSLAMVLRFFTDNAVSSSSLNAVLARAGGGGSGAGGAHLLASGSGLPWASLQAAPAPAPLPLPRGANLALRVLTQPQLNCSAPLRWDSTGVLGGGGWTLRSTSVCRDGRSQLLLSCAACELSTEASITLLLPFTCQSLYLEALAVDASGRLSTLSFPTEKSVAEAVAAKTTGGAGAVGTGLLTQLQWFLEPMVTVLEDAVAGREARGLRLLQGTAAVVRSGGSAPLAIEPLSASVLLTVSFGLQTVYAVTTVTPRESAAELLVNLFGLMGVAAAFQLVLRAVSAAESSSACKRCCQHLGKQPLLERSGSSSAAAGTDDVTEGVNPLKRCN
jgi:hypothetical protein